MNGFFPDYFSFELSLDHFLFLLEIETKLVKFCSEFHVKQVEIWLSKYTSLLLLRKQV